MPAVMRMKSGKHLISEVREMWDLYDWRGFVLRTHSGRAFWNVATRVLGKSVGGYIYVHRDGQALGQARSLAELNDLMS